MKLLADYEEIGITLELTSENNWKGMFTDLPGRYRDQGKEIKYTLEEVPVEGYDTTITGNADDGFVVENKHTPKLTEVKVFKIWDDDNDKNGDRPNGITVVLLKDGKAFRQAVLNEGNGWQHTFSDLKTKRKPEKRSSIPFRNWMFRKVYCLHQR